MLLLPWATPAGQSFAVPLEKTPAMTDEESLLFAILQAPHDPTLGLMYADWLEERGDARSEVVRLRYAELEDPVGTLVGKSTSSRLDHLVETVGDPFEGLLLFRGELQRCRLTHRGWLSRIWELTGPLTVKIEHRYHVWGTVWVNGDKADGASLNNQGWNQFRFSLRAATGRAYVRLGVRYNEFTITPTAMILSVDGVPFYRED
jgi:uncharacterized protein (TIGR02996 family)